MLTALGLILRLVAHKFVVGIAFALKHWRVTLPIVLCVLVALAVKHHFTVVKERDQAVAAYATHIDNDDRDRAIRRKENQLKEEAYAQETEKRKSEHAATILKLKEFYNASLKNKDAAIADANSMRDSLRRKLEAANAAATRLPEGTNRPIRLTGVRQDCDAAGSGQADAEYINTLEYACAITTADYNTLYDRCKAVNKIFGVQQP